MELPPPCRPGSTLPALMEELVEEILIRIPPDEPAHLFRAALVWKPWWRILTDPGFLRRYRVFHRAPPFLGYLNKLDPGIPPLAPTSAPSPLSTNLPELRSCSNWVLDCRHGRVLIHCFMPCYCLVVWNPISGGQKNLKLPAGYDYTSCAGAVLCAVDGCDHLNCQDGPFLIVFSGSGDCRDDDLEIWVAIYSSKTGLWSASITVPDHYFVLSWKPLLIRDTLYFIAEDNIILKCDFIAHELSVIESPGGFDILMEIDGGRLGCGRLGFVSIEDNCLYILSWQGNANNGTGAWAQHLVMELKTLLPTGDGPSCSYEVVGLLEGINIVFISVSCVGLFTLDLKSKKVKRVGETEPYYGVLPYTGFYNPDLATGRNHHFHNDGKIDQLP